MTKSKSVRIALAVAVLVLVSAASSRAWIGGHENRLTFNQPVALPGIVLPAGTYSFDIVDDQSSLDLVVVKNASRTKTYYMGFTDTVPRPKGLPANTAVTFGERPADAPMPIAAWYPLGLPMGHQFLYR